MRWGVRTLIKLYRKAGVRTYDSYEDARHEMLNELNRGKVRASVLALFSAAPRNQSPHREPL
jgi:alpha-beta hydrolase superfamily lysophospholipase